MDRFDGNESENKKNRAIENMADVEPVEYEKGKLIRGGGFWHAVRTIALPVLLAVALVATALWGD